MRLPFAYVVASILGLLAHCVLRSNGKSVAVNVDGSEVDREGLEFFSDKELIIELRSRGYKVAKRKKDSRVVPAELGGKKQNDAAIRAAEAGRLWDSIRMFKKLVSSIPHNAEYWNNLGVTQMRASVYHSAEVSMRESLKQNPSYSEAQENLEVLQAYLPSQLPHPPSREQRHSRRSMKRIDAKELYANPDYAEYAAGKRPFILTGGMDGAIALTKWDLPYFIQLFPTAYMDHYPQNMFVESVKPRFVPIGEAFEDLEMAASNRSTFYKNKPGVYIQWNLDFPSWHRLMDHDVSQLPKLFREDDEWMDRCFSSDQARSDWQRGTHWRMLLIGSQGSGMFGHKDNLRTSSWQVQVSGYKRWHICSPSQDGNMYTAGDVDAFSPDYQKWPKFKSANCIDDVAAPGEMLFYPKDYWHQTEVWPGEDGRPSISVTGTAVDANNYESVREELLKECHDGQPRISLTKQVCKDLEEKCFPLWAKMWGRDES